MSVGFGSDNHSGIHPSLLEAMVEANTSHAPSYGQDSYSNDLRKKVKELFEAQSSYIVFNGTAANVLCIQACLESYHAVLCTDVSHLNVDECGAPEKIAGCKLIPVKSHQGKFDIKNLEKTIFRKGDQHFSQIKMLSITQPTEYGTLYSWDEIRRLREFCDQHQLYLHMDGARLSNAAASLNCSWKELVQDVDILSFGGGKNGFLMGEMVIVRNPEIKKDLKFLRKQSLQLPAKTRFIAAPFLKYFSNELWREIAEHENAMALKLSNGLKAIGVEISQPTQANGVFCYFPREIIKELKKKFFFYVWDENTFEVRLMTSFDTQKEDVDAFIQEVNTLINQ